jgi:hypothetical protein
MLPNLSFRHTQPRAAGLNGYLAKPVGPGALAQLLTERTSRTQTRKSASAHDQAALDQAHDENCLTRHLAIASVTVPATEPRSRKAATAWATMLVFLVLGSKVTSVPTQSGKFSI